MRFIIWCYPYNHKYGGIQVLHRLCHLLNEAGYKAYVNQIGKPGWNNPLWNNDLRSSDYVIYPDCIQHNPFLGKKIIRYMLYYPSAYFGGVRLCKGEMIVPFNYTYLKECNDCSDKPLTEDNILKIPIIEPELFFSDNTLKIKSAYYIGKAADKTDKNNATSVLMTNIPTDAILITRKWPDKREALATLLRETKDFYTFDHNTAMAEEAYYSGCNVYLVNKDGSLLPWRQELRDTLYKAPYTKENLLKQYNDLDKIHKFVKQVREYFNGKNM